MTGRSNLKANSTPPPPPPHEFTLSNQSELLKSFGFSSAEIKFAQAFLDHCCLGRAADALFISRNTARTHLANLFAKTGCRRQAELMKLLCVVSVAGERG